MNSTHAVKAGEQPVHQAGARLSASNGKWARAAWLCGALLLVAVLVTHGIHKGEFILNQDEPHHAFTGLYMADFLRDLPLSHPIQYTYLYYARYPVLGIVHWPPLFYLVEGVVFLLLGPSVVTARIAILLFVLFGLFFWFKLLRALEGTFAAAAASAAVLGLLPFLLLYEKSVMLEVPSLAICIAAIYCWFRFLRGGASRYVYWFAILAALALLTKQQSVFLVPFCVLTILTEKKWRLAFDRRLWITVGLVLLIAGPFYVLDVSVAPRGIHEAVVQGNRVLAHPATFYLTILPKQIGWPLLVLALLGIATFRWWGRLNNTLFMLMWIAACYVMFSPIAIKEPRYILDWVPPFVYFATVPWASKAAWRWRLMRPVAVAVLVALVVTEARADWRYQRPYVSGYKAAADKLVSENQPGIVLYDAGLSANFCFFLRTADPARRYVLMRKGLWVVDEASKMGADELVKSRPGIERLLASYGIRFIIVDNGPVNFQIQTILRNLLQTPQFKLIQEFPVESNISWLQGRKLFLYENLDAAAPTATTLRLRMLGLRHDIVVPMNKLLKQ